MKLKRAFIFVSVFLLFWIAGCSPEQPFEPSSAPSEANPTPSAAAVLTPTPEPTPTPAPQIPSYMNAQYMEMAGRLLRTMTLERKAEQIFFVQFPSNDDAIPETQYGGYLLFRRNYEDTAKSKLTKLIQSYQDANAIGLLIGGDEEGGEVTRLSLYEEFAETPFLSPQELYENGGLDEIKTDTAIKDAILRGVGINVNLGPVCDVSTDPDDYIYNRSFGKDAEQTAEYVDVVVRQMVRDNMGCVLKHFPGYGSNSNTHTDESVSNKSYETFVQEDFLPFEAGFEAGAGAVMVSHNIESAFDPDLPASLSPRVHEALRDELNFNGVIMTDDLSMDAIMDVYEPGEAAVKAFLAGNDMIIYTDTNVPVDAIVSAVQDGKITETELNNSVLRILCWKLSLGIIK